MGWQFFFFLILKDVSFVFLLAWFLLRSLLYFIFFLFWKDVPFTTGCLKDFLFVFGFLNMMCLGGVYVRLFLVFAFVLFGVFCTWICCLVCHSFWKNFVHYFFRYFLCTVLFPSGIQLCLYYMIWYGPNLLDVLLCIIHSVFSSVWVYLISVALFSSSLIFFPSTVSSLLLSLSKAFIIISFVFDS